MSALNAIAQSTTVSPAPYVGGTVLKTIAVPALTVMGSAISSAMGSIPFMRLAVGIGVPIIAVWGLGRTAFSHPLEEDDPSMEVLTEGYRAIQEAGSSAKQTIMKVQNGTRLSNKQMDEILESLDVAAADMGKQRPEDPKVKSFKQDSEGCIAVVRQRLSNWRRDPGQESEFSSALSALHEKIFVGHNELLNLYLLEEREQKMLTQKQAFQKVVEAATPVRRAIDRVSSMIFEEISVDTDELRPVVKAMENLVNAIQDVLND